MKNMGKIMKEAHRLTREIKGEFPEVDYKTQLGICISYLLNEREGNKMVELEGSEKQIKWATDIKREKTKELEELKENIKNMNNNTFFIFYRNNESVLEECFPKHRKEFKNTVEAKEWIIKKIDETLKAIENISSSKYIIGLRNVKSINLVFSIFRPAGEYMQILKNN